MADFTTKELKEFLEDKLGFEVYAHLYASRPGLQELKCLFFSERSLEYVEHFKLTLFLLWNGVSPAHVMRWYRVRGLLRDVAAVKHVESLLQEWNANDPKWDRYFTFCLTHECWWDIGFNHPHFFSGQ